MSAEPPSMMTVQSPVSASSTTASPSLPAGTSNSVATLPAGSLSSKVRVPSVSFSSLNSIFSPWSAVAGSSPDKPLSSTDSSSSRS